MSSFKKPGFGSEIPVLGPILHHREVAILENREAGYSQVGYRPSRNQVPGRSFDSRPIGGPDLSRVREAADGKLGCRPSGNQVPDNKSRFLGRFYIIGKRAFTKSSKKPGMWLSDDPGYRPDPPSSPRHPGPAGNQPAGKPAAQRTPGVDVESPPPARRPGRDPGHICRREPQQRVGTPPT